MSQYNYTRQKYNVLENASAASNVGTPILASDFKTVFLDLLSAAGATVDGDLVVYASDDYDAPDVGAPLTPTNTFFELAYSDTRNGITYGPTTLTYYNPSSSTPGGDARFNVESQGARWIIACVTNVVSGTVNVLSVTLYDNQ